MSALSSQAVEQNSIMSRKTKQLSISQKDLLYEVRSNNFASVDNMGQLASLFNASDLRPRNQDDAIVMLGVHKVGETPVYAIPDHLWLTANCKKFPETGTQSVYTPMLPFHAPNQAKQYMDKVKFPVPPNATTVDFTSHAAQDHLRAVNRTFNKRTRQQHDEWESDDEVDVEGDEPLPSQQDLADLLKKAQDKIKEQKKEMEALRDGHAAVLDREAACRRNAHEWRRYAQGVVAEQLGANTPVQGVNTHPKAPLVYPNFKVTVNHAERDLQSPEKKRRKVPTTYERPSHIPTGSLDDHLEPFYNAVL